MREKVERKLRGNSKIITYFKNNFIFRLILSSKQHWAKDKEAFCVIFVWHIHRFTCYYHLLPEWYQPYTNLSTLSRPSHPHSICLLYHFLLMLGYGLRQVIMTCIRNYSVILTTLLINVSPLFSFSLAHSWNDQLFSAAMYFVFSQRLVDDINVCHFGCSMVFHWFACLSFHQYYTVLNTVTSSPLIIFLALLKFWFDPILSVCIALGDNIAHGL